MAGTGSEENSKGVVAWCKVLVPLSCSLVAFGDREASNEVTKLLCSKDRAYSAGPRWGARVHTARLLGRITGGTEVCLPPKEGRS